MPVLPISDGKGNPDLFGPAVVLATSIYPKERDDRRARLLANLFAHTLITAPELFEEDARQEIALELLPALVDSPDLQALVRKASRFLQSSWIAGEILLMLLSSVVHHPELQATPTKVISAVCELFQDAETWGGERIDVKVRTAWRAWSNFQSVAHIHAIRQIWLKKEADQGVQDQKSLDFENFARFSIEEFGEYLALTEFFRRAAIERQILDFDKTWRPPDDLDIVPAEIDIPALPDTAIDAIRSYVPEHSRDFIP